MSDLPWDALAEARGFVADRRFEGLMSGGGIAGGGDGFSMPGGTCADPYARGYDDGFAAARAEQQQADMDNASQARWAELAISRLNDETEAELRERLRVTVLALCEGALAPLTVDEEALRSRIDKALAMLRRAQDEKQVFLNPEDAAMLAGTLPEEVSVHADPKLVRGAIRIETPDGGLEDGPAEWRAILEEALDIC